MHSGYTEKFIIFFGSTEQQEITVNSCKEFNVGHYDYYDYDDELDITTTYLTRSQSKFTIYSPHDCCTPETIIDLIKQADAIFYLKDVTPENIEKYEALRMLNEKCIAIDFVQINETATTCLKHIELLQALTDKSRAQKIMTILMDKQNKNSLFHPLPTEVTTQQILQRYLSMPYSPIFFSLPKNENSPNEETNVSDSFTMEF